MKVITNERRYKQNRFLATMFSVSGMLMMLSSIVTAFVSEELEVTGYPLVIIGTFMALIGIHLSRKWLRQPLSHEALSNALKGIGKDAVLLHYWGDAPHILIQGNHIFSLTTRNQPFSLVIDGETWVEREAPFKRFQKVLTGEGLGKPIPEAQRDARQAAKWLQKQTGESVTVQPIIVFLHPKTQLLVEKQPTIPITYADKRTPTLKNYIKQGGKDELKPEQIEMLVEKLETINNK